MSVNVKNLHPSLNKYLEERVLNGLKNSAWYSPEGNNTLNLQLTGNVSNYYNEKPVILSHEYTVSIPYTAYMPVLKTKQVPYETTKTVYDYSTGSSYIVPATAYRTEYYTIQQPYTAYRKEPRTHHFQGFEYKTSNFSINDSVYGSIFYMATGFHGFHVFVGTVFIAAGLLRHIKYHFTDKQHFGFESSAWYWHFVDVVWIFLFGTIYWWGS